MPAAGILGWKRSKYQRPILHNSKSPETSREHVSEYIKNIGRRKYQRGPTPWPRGWGAHPPLQGAPPASWAPCWPSGAHLLLYEVFRPKKNHKQAFGTRLHRHEAEPWRNQSRAPADLFCRGHFPPGREIIAIVITNAPLIGRGPISINIFTSTISSQTLVHLLYPILVSKSGIGTCRLLVVLITPCS